MASAQTTVLFGFEEALDQLAFDDAEVVERPWGERSSITIAPWCAETQTNAGTPVASLLAARLQRVRVPSR